MGNKIWFLVVASDGRGQKLMSTKVMPRYFGRDASKALRAVFKLDLMDELADTLPPWWHGKIHAIFYPRQMRGHDESRPFPISFAKKRKVQKRDRAATARQHHILMTMQRQRNAQRHRASSSS